jgi:hypothetical protein
MKLYVYITDPLLFIRPDNTSCGLSVFPEHFDGMEGIWIFLGVVDIEITEGVNSKALELTLAVLDKTEKKLKDQVEAKLATLKATRSELLSLPAPE